MVSRPLRTARFTITWYNRSILLVLLDERNAFFFGTEDQTRKYNNVGKRYCRLQRP